MQTIFAASAIATPATAACRGTTGRGEGSSKPRAR